MSEKKQGFTLIELLVSIAIVGILSTVAVIGLSSTRMRARDAKRIADLKQITKALELYYNDNGHYPPACTCTYDCNGYCRSHSPDWLTLAAALQPYIDPLPVDPVNVNCQPWNDGCYSYAYGNVGLNSNPHTYDLLTQLEDPDHPDRCEVKGYVFYFNDVPWCGPYSGQIYEASPD